jgi:hypothetical protein
MEALGDPGFLSIALNGNGVGGIALAVGEPNVCSALLHFKVNKAQCASYMLVAFSGAEIQNPDTRQSR